MASISSGVFGVGPVRGGAGASASGAPFLRERFDNLRLHLVER